MLQTPASASGGPGIIIVDLHHQARIPLALVLNFQASKAFRFLLSTSCMVMTVSYESPARPSEATYHQLDTKQAGKQCTLEEGFASKTESRQLESRAAPRA